MQSSTQQQSSNSSIFHRTSPPAQATQAGLLPTPPAPPAAGRDNWPPFSTPAEVVRVSENSDPPRPREMATRPTSLVPVPTNAPGIGCGPNPTGRGIYAASPFDLELRRTQLDIYVKNLQAKLAAIRGKLYKSDHEMSKEAMLVATNELQRLYRELLLLDLETAVSTQMEHLLWNDCFKKPLSFLKPLDPALFHFVLENGVGYYLGLIQEVGLHFDVAFIKNSSIPADELNIARMKPVIKCTPTKAVVYYIIQNSIIHVGDLLRYRGSLNEALKMYDKSTAVSPSYGHAFNQMGLVQTMINDKDLDSLLTTMYCYTRAVCVARPFLGAQKNMAELLAKVVGFSAMPEKAEDESILKFFRRIADIVNPLAFFCQEELANMAAHERRVGVGHPNGPGRGGFEIRVELFTFSQLFRMLVIALWAYKRESDKKLIGIESHHEPEALELIIHLLNGITATGCCELKSVADFVGLSHLNILLEWLRRHLYLLQHPVFRAKINVGWLCRAANQALKEETLCKQIARDLFYVILPEEKRLLGFLPLRGAYDHLQSVMADADPRIIALRISRLSKLMEFFSKPEFLLLGRFGKLYQPVVFANMDPRELWGPALMDPVPGPPSRCRDGCGSTLQHIFNQFGGGSGSIRGGGSDWGTGGSSGIQQRPRRGRGLLSEALAKVLDKEREGQEDGNGKSCGGGGTSGSGQASSTRSCSTRSPSPTTTQMDHLSIEFERHAGDGCLSSEMSPTPLTDGDGEGRPSNTDFSKVFQSIWTPFSGESALAGPMMSGGSGGENSIWKF